MRWDRNYRQPEPPINDPAVIPAYGVTDVERAYWNKKQDALVFEDRPREKSDKMLLSGVIWGALEEYKVQAIASSQAFFWGQVGGLAQTKEACESAAGRAESAETNAEAYKNAAEGYKNDASGYASDASGYASNASGYASAASGSKDAAALSAAAAATKTEDAEAWAKGTRNGVDVESTDPAYHNNAKYYADQASAAPDIINDTETSQYKTWSSSKISSELSGKASTSAVAGIQDVIPSDAASDNKLLSTAALAGVTFTVVDDDICINW